MFADVPQFKGAVAHFGKHPCFVGREDGTVVVINERPKSNSCWAPEIDVSDRFIAQHSSKHQACVELGEAATGLINVEDVMKTALPEAEPILGTVFMELLVLNREPIGGKRAEK